MKKIAISYFANAWYISQNPDEISCNNEILTDKIDEDDREYLSDIDALLYIDTYKADTYQNITSAKIVKVVKFSDYDLEKFINEVKKLKEKYGIINAQTDVINNKLQLTAFNPASKKDEVIRELIANRLEVVSDFEIDNSSFAEIADMAKNQVNCIFEDRLMTPDDLDERRYELFGHGCQYASNEEQFFGINLEDIL